MGIVSDSCSFQAAPSRGFSEGTSALSLSTRARSFSDSATCREEGGGRWVAVGGERAQGGLMMWALHPPGIQCRLLEPPVGRTQTAQGLLGEGSRFGQRWEGLTQLRGRGRKGLARGQVSELDLS